MNILGTTRRRTVFVAMLFASLLILRTPAAVFGQDDATKAATTTPAAATQPATTPTEDAAAPANATATPATDQSDKKEPAATVDKASTTGDPAANKSQPAASGALATGTPPAAGAKPRLSPVVLVAIIVAVFAIPMWLGGYLSRRLKMPDHGWKMSLALIMFLASGVIVYFGEFKLGPDLAGGMTLIYEVQDSGGREVKMPELIAALKKRVDPTSTREVTIRAYGNSPAVEVIIPRASGDELKYVKRNITDLGQLEFRITANPTRGDIQGIIAQAKLAPPGQTDVIVAGEKKAEWVPYELKEFSAPEVPDDRMVKRMGLEEPEALVLIDPLNVSGEYLTNASKGVDERGGPAVHFSFNSRGAAYFGQLTSENLPNQATGAKRYLGIILDKRLVSAPSINSKITDQGMISGGSMSEQDVDHTVSVLNAGSLPAVLNKTPVSENYVSSTLGDVAIRQGKTAIIVSFVAIVLFMMFYYRLAGVISVVALILNLLMVLALMMMIKAAFTLPGLAGLVLTIGIAVDANVLIFERIREELRHGAALRMAIRNGYERATRTIVDANMTTIISGVVMYLVGRDQIKGFAVTLILGVLVSMFTAIFCSRIIFDVLERKGWIKTLKMRSIVGETNIDFMGWQYWAIGISWVCILIGFIAVFARGQGLFNIDFTGGSSVTFVLDTSHPKSIELVQAAFDKTDLQHKSLVVQHSGETDRRYTINTSEQSVDTVKKTVVDAFPNELMNYSFELGELKSFTEGDMSGTEAKVMVNDDAKKYASDDGISHDALLEQIRSTLKDDGKTDVTVTATTPGYRTGSSVRFKEWNLRLTGINPDGTRTVLEKVKTEMDATPMFPLANKIGGRVSANLQLQALKAISMSCFGIIAYLWLRFQKASFGLAAVIALLHDVLFTVGMVAMSYYVVQLMPGVAKLLKIDSFQISLDIVAALLTIIGYSVNDTIIVFDRLREVRGKSPELTIDMINASVNQTLGRTLLTSFTVFLVVVILYWIGGEGIHGFAYCMVIGVFVGTYSSIYIASPILYWLSGTKKSLADKGAAPRNVGQRAQALGG